MTDTARALKSERIMKSLTGMTPLECKNERSEIFAPYLKVSIFNSGGDL